MEYLIGAALVVLVIALAIRSKKQDTHVASNPVTPPPVVTPEAEMPGPDVGVPGGSPTELNQSQDIR